MGYAVFLFINKDIKKSPVPITRERINGVSFQWDMPFFSNKNMKIPRSKRV